MSRVHTYTRFSPVFEPTPQSVPSVARPHDAKIGISTTTPSAKPLNVHAKVFEPDLQYRTSDNNSIYPHILLSQVINLPAAPAPCVSQLPALPQPLQPAFVPTSISEPSGASAHVNQYENLLGRIEVQQEDLRDARDTLVGSRYRLRTKRENLRTTREQAVGQVGEAFETMRQYFLAKNLDVPDEIRSAWSGVDIIRDRLGCLETDYEEAEERYNKEEWKYTQKETGFVESLSLDTPSASVSHVEQMATDMMRDLTRFTNDHMDTGQTSDVSDGLYVLSGPEYTPRNSPDPSDGIMHTVPTSPRSDTPASRFLDSHYTPPILQATGTAQSQDDARLTHHRLQWSDTIENIESWMLGALEVSPFHKAWLKSLVPTRVDSDEDIWPLIVRHWKSDSSSTAIFHSGDTTVSGTGMSQAVSSSAGQGAPSSSQTDFDTRLASVYPLFVGDQMPGAMASFENPPRIKREDLVDPPRHVAFHFGSSSSMSMSTPPTVMPKSSPSSESEFSMSTGSVSTRPGVPMQTSSSVAYDRASSFQSTSTQPTVMGSTSNLPMLNACTPQDTSEQEPPCFMKQYEDSMLKEAVSPNPKSEDILPDNTPKIKVTATQLNTSHNQGSKNTRSGRIRQYPYGNQLPIDVLGPPSISLDPDMQERLASGPFIPDMKSASKTPDHHLSEQ